MNLAQKSDNAYPKKPDDLIISKDKTSNNYKYRKNYLIVCEGYTDAKFLAYLLFDRKIYDFDIHHPQDEHGLGKSGFSMYLKAFDLTRNSESVAGIVIVGDNDTNPAKDFEQIQRFYADNGFPAPSAPLPLVEKDEKIKTGVLMLPETGVAGQLEDLLLEVVFELDPEIKGCIESFAECAKGPLNWTDNQKSKMQAHALIAAKNQKGPGDSLSYVWGKSTNPFTVQHNKYDFIVERLKGFIDSS